MKKLFALLPLLVVQLAHAQDYKELKREDIPIVISSHDSKTDQYFTYHPNGKIETASDGQLKF